MFLDKTTIRVTGSVSVLLVLAFVATGFLAAAYRREKLALGESHYVQGQTLEKRSDLEGAVEEYRKALLYSPDKAEYRLSFAESLVEGGHLEEAESHVDQLLQEDPTNGVLNLIRGRIALRRHQMAKAIDFYQRAVYEYWPPARSEERRKARWELIGLLDRSGRREELIGELMTMYANAPNDKDLRTRIGFELLGKSATSEGTQVFRDLTRVAPRDPQVHRGLGEAYLTSGDFVSARHEFERALRLDPKDRASTESLAVTNAIIDMNPEMPSLTSAERYRRSQNLLRRVLGELGRCGTDAADERTGAARDMVAAKSSRDPDVALQMQSMAEQLWGTRANLCASGKQINDPTLAKVLERIANE